MKMDEFLARLINVRRLRQGQYQARCPAHDDENPSLAIGTGRGGRILIKCHGGCLQDAVLAAMGLTMRDLYSNVPRSSERGTSAKSERPRRGGWQNVEAAVSYYVETLPATLGGDWEYPGGAFRMLRFNLRDGSKTFRPIHREGQIWRAGDPRGGLPLYRADKLPVDGLVFITEGEKCADAVVALGLAAVTSAHGAEASGKSEWTPLAGRDVAILPDNNKPGEGYAEAVVAILHKLNPPARVRIVRLPDLPEHGDVVDWSEAHDGQDGSDLAAELVRMAGGQNCKIGPLGNPSSDPSSDPPSGGACGYSPPGTSSVPA